MLDIKLKTSELTVEEQDAISIGFALDTKEKDAPEYVSLKLNWLAYDENKLVGALTANLLWDWIYIDELWIDRIIQNRGFGKALITKVEDYAKENNINGLWLWTQSWQAEGFYKKLGYEEFTRFPNFPNSHSRIGLRKILQ